jgi:hypothetical protein
MAGNQTPTSPSGAGLPEPAELSAYSFVNRYSARTLPLKLGLVIAALVLLHIVMMFLYFETTVGLDGEDAARLHSYQVESFNLDKETGFGTYYSALALLFIGRLLWQHARRSGRRKEIWRFWWFTLALGFHWLALDEAIAAHEILNEHKGRVADAAGEARVRWTHEGSYVAALVGCAFLPFLWHVGKRLAAFSIIGGAVYLGGCLGIEQATDKYQDWGMLKTFEYMMWVGLEEGMEMAGPVIFLAGLMAYLVRDKQRHERGRGA